MPISFKARCERIRSNNGITEILFTRHSTFSGEARQDEHVLVNAHIVRGEFEEGNNYIVDIRPADSTPRAVE